MGDSYPAAWYPDPYGRHEVRWHDGTSYTENVADEGPDGKPVLSTDPTAPPIAPPIQMSAPPLVAHAGTHREFKALAKATRPWYRKKRYWAVAAVGLVAAGSAAASSGLKSPAKASGGPSTFSRNSEHPPAGDVIINTCEPGQIVPDVRVSILNHSSRRSDYLISVNLLDSGGTKIGEATGASNNLDEDQPAELTLLATADGPVTDCVISEVNRIASN